ncbi:2' [Durusdinium trenchii]|uniref:2 n=1 Tax=Durusdinium trenchii TaxID=1381693 RepID=A0ABP0HE62_9DINO
MSDDDCPDLLFGTNCTQPWDEHPVNRATWWLHTWVVPVSFMIAGLLSLANFSRLQKKGTLVGFASLFNILPCFLMGGFHLVGGDLLLFDMDDTGSIGNLLLILGLYLSFAHFIVVVLILHVLVRSGAESALGKKSASKSAWSQIKLHVLGTHVMLMIPYGLFASDAFGQTPVVAARLMLCMAWLTIAFVFYSLKSYGFPLERQLTESLSKMSKSSTTQEALKKLHLYNRVMLMVCAPLLVSYPFLIGFPVFHFPVVYILVFKLMIPNAICEVVDVWVLALGRSLRRKRSGPLQQSLTRLGKALGSDVVQPVAGERTNEALLADEALQVVELKDGRRLQVVRGEHPVVTNVVCRGAPMVGVPMAVKVELDGDGDGNFAPEVLPHLKQTPQCVGQVLEFRAWVRPTLNQAGKKPVAHLVDTRQWQRQVCVQSAPAQMPPPRPLVEARLLGPKQCASDLRVMTYNLLADAYKHHFDKMYSYCPGEFLDLNYRASLQLQEVLAQDPDVLCLQEVDSKMFWEFWKPQLSDTHVGFLTLKKGGAAEGCASFVKRGIDVRSFEEISFRDLASNSEWVEELERTMPSLGSALRGVKTVAQVLRLSNGITVANTHLFYHPHAGHVRCVQAKQLVEKLGIDNDDDDDDDSKGVVICGDLNAQHFDLALGLLLSGAVSAEHPEWATSAGFAWGPKEWDTPKMPHTGAHLRVAHPFTSACGMPAFTNFCGSWSGDIDWILVDPTIDRLERENARLRASVRRWKRKFEREVQVNHELGRRLRAESRRPRLVAQVAQIGGPFQWTAPGVHLPQGDLERFCDLGREQEQQAYGFVLTGGAGGCRDLDDAWFAVCLPSAKICVLSKQPFFQALHRVLERLAKTKPSHWPALLDRLNDRWRFPKPVPSRLDLLFEYGHDALDHPKLPRDAVLFVIGALLLESKVVLVSQDRAKLSRACLALVALLRPARWLHPFLPILPHDLLVLAQAPVPVLLGIPQTTDLAITELLASQQPDQDLVVVLHLDDGRLHLSNPAAYHELKLPGLDQLDSLDPKDIHAHIQSLLVAARFFGPDLAAILAADNNSLPPRALRHAQVHLERILSAPLSSPPWHFLAGLHRTQLFTHWHHAHQDNDPHESFRLTALLSEEEDGSHAASL